MLEKQTTVLVAEGNELFRATISKALQSGGYNVVGSAGDGNTAKELMNALHPSVIVLDLMLPKLDGISVLKSLPAETRPKILLLSAFATEFIASTAAEIGADYLMLKPCAAQAVAMRVGEILTAATKDNHLRVEEVPSETAITDIMHEIGVPSHIQGFKYLREAIILAVKDNDVVNAMTKELYPQVASTFCTTPARVERSIRHAIEVAWERGDLDTLQRFFGYSVSNTKGKPTNSEFIALIADRLLLQSRNRKLKSACYSSAPFLCTNSTCIHRCR